MNTCQLKTRNGAKTSAMLSCGCGPCIERASYLQAKRRANAARRKTREAKRAASPVVALLHKARALRKARSAGFRPDAATNLQLGQAGLSRAEGVELLRRHRADRLADAAARFAEKSIAHAMRNGFQNSDTRGHVGELEERNGFSALDTDIDNARMTHATMGVAWAEKRIAGVPMVITCETHGKVRKGETIAAAVVFRACIAEGVDSGYGLRARKASQLIGDGIATRGMALHMIGDAARSAGFDPDAFLLWIDTSGDAAEERHAVKTPNSAPMAVPSVELR